MTADLVGKLRRLSLDVDRAVPLETPSNPRRWPLWMTALLASVGLAFAGGYYFARDGETKAVAASGSAATTRPAPAAIAGLSASGYVVARRRATIAAQV